MRDGRTVRDSLVQSVHRAISVLQVPAAHGAAGVTEIATELGVPKSTVFRMLSTAARHLRGEGVPGAHGNGGSWKTSSRRG